MTPPDHNPASENRWPDETVSQPAGAESVANPRVVGHQPHDLSVATLPPAPRHLDETGEAPKSPLGDWQGTWIEDA